MAEVDTGGGGGKKNDGKRRAKKGSTKVDMTAMVDMAFLLLTFFMLTTTFNKPKMMEINMPDKNKELPDETMKVPASRTVTVILGKDNKVYWYQGDDDNPAVAVEETDFSENGIRNALLRKSAEIRALPRRESDKENPEPIVIIKAMDKSKYKNLVDILDEMHITGVKIYAIVDFTEDDRKLLAVQHPNSVADMAPLDGSAPAATGTTTQ